MLNSCCVCLGVWWPGCVAVWLCGYVVVVVAVVGVHDDNGDDDDDDDTVMLM